MINYPNYYHSSAPGSVMLFGEHAVLRNRYCLVGAVTERIRVTLTPRTDQQVKIESSLGTEIIALNSITTLLNNKPQHKFAFILASIAYYLTRLDTGFDLLIEADFSHQVGLGSSAAVVVACLDCLRQYLNLVFDAKQLLLTARRCIRQVQGCGSGADVAASVYGGIVAYRPEPLAIECIDYLPEVSLVYAGYKTATPKVIQQVSQTVANNPVYYEQLFQTIEQCTLAAKTALLQQDLASLGQLMQQHQSYQAALGTSDKVLDQLLQQIAQQTTIKGAKISGSGLGDCLITLGKIQANTLSLTNQQCIIPITLSQQGVRHASS